MEYMHGVTGGQWVNKIVKYTLSLSYVVPHIFLIDMNWLRVLTNDGREFHKFAPAILTLDFLISSGQYRTIIFCISKIMIIYIK